MIRLLQGQSARMTCPRRGSHPPVTCACPISGMPRGPGPWYFFFAMHAPTCLPACPCHATPLLQHHCSILPTLIISVSKCVLLNLTVATTASAPVLAILCVTHLSHKFALLCIELASKHCIVRVSLGFTVFILSDVEFVSLCMPILLASVHHCWCW